MADIYSELIAALGENLAGDPAGYNGRFYWNSVSLFPKYYNGTVWKTHADTNSAQVFTLKDYDGGTASNTSRTTIPKDTLANLTSLTRKEATLVYATDHKKPYFDTGLVLKPVGSGGTGGGINYIDNPSAADDLTGWASSGAGVTVTRTTTAANLPRESLTDSAIVITCVSGTTDYAYFRFQLGDADKAKQLFLSWAQKALSGYVAGDLVLEMWSNSASNYGGTYTQLSVANPDLAAGDYVMGTTWNSTTADYYELRVRIAAGTGALAICDASASPQIPVSVPFVKDSVRFPLVVTNLGNTYQSFASYSLCGNMMTIPFFFQNDNSPGAGANIEISLPLGFTPASSTFDLENLGSCYFHDYSTNIESVVLPVLESGVIHFKAPGGVGAYYTGGDFSNFDWLAGTLHIAVNEASSNIFVADNAVEYAYNSGTWNADDGTSFAYGQGGGTIGGSISAILRTHTVRFQTPIQPTDKIELQFSSDGVFWGPAGIINLAGNFLQPGVVEIGAIASGAELVPVNSTDINVRIYQYQWAEPDGSSNTNWTTGFWRVMKASNPIGIGHDLATPTKTGLITSDTQNIGGVKIFEGGLANNSSYDNAVLTYTVTNDDKRTRYYSPGAGNPAAVILPSTGVVAGDVWDFVVGPCSNFELEAANAVVITMNNFGAGSAADPRLNDSGRILLRALIDTPLTPADWQVLHVEEAGTWTPTVSTGTANAGFYSRVNNKVSIAYRGSATLTAGGGTHNTTTVGNPVGLTAGGTSILFTLPHLTNFTTTNQLMGTCVCTDGAYNAADWYTKGSEVYSGSGANPTQGIAAFTNANVGTQAIAYYVTAMYDLVR